MPRSILINKSGFKKFLSLETRSIGYQNMPCFLDKHVGKQHESTFFLSKYGITLQMISEQMFSSVLTSHYSCKQSYDFFIPPKLLPDTEQWK